MKTGDMIRIPPASRTENGYQYPPKEIRGLILSSRITRWDSRVVFYSILTEEGKVEDIPHFPWHHWEVVSEGG